MELLAALASGMTPHAPVTPAIAAAGVTIIAILSATGHLTELSHVSETLNTGYVVLLGYLAVSGSLSDGITAWLHHVVDSPVVLVVLVVLCFTDGFFPPLPSESIVIRLTSWLITSPPGTVVPLWVVFPTADVGAILGDSFAFFLGAHIPAEKVFFLNRGKRRTACDLTRRTLHRRGTSLIFAACFTPGGRTAVNICVGATNFSYARFSCTDFMAVMCWVACGATIDAVSEEIIGRVHPLFAVAMGVIGGLVLSLVTNRLASWAQKCSWDKPVLDSSDS